MPRLILERSFFVGDNANLGLMYVNFLRFSMFY